MNEDVLTEDERRKVERFRLEGGHAGMASFLAIIDRLTKRLQAEREITNDAIERHVKCFKRLRESEVRVRELERMVNDSEANLLGIIRAEAEKDVAG